MIHCSLTAAKSTIALWYTVHWQLPGFVGSAGFLSQFGPNAGQYLLFLRTTSTCQTICSTSQFYTGFKNTKLISQSKAPSLFGLEHLASKTWPLNLLNERHSCHTFTQQHCNYFISFSTPHAHLYTARASRGKPLQAIHCMNHTSSVHCVIMLCFDWNVATWTDR